MPLQIYFNFDNQALEVMKFYSEVFNSPYDVAFFENEPSKVLHGSMNILDSHVMFSDIHEEHTLIIGNHITLSINLTQQDLLIELFNRLIEGGHVLMPLQETFWSPAYGVCIDKFGTTWQFNLDT
jgi:PhnB protein